MAQTSLLFPLPLLALSLASPAQGEIHELAVIDNGNPFLGYGNDGAANMGDLDGDGIDDLVVGCSSGNTNQLKDGTVFLFSGRTWKEIWRIYGTNQDGRFGASVENLGDVDKDGVPDIGIGSPTAPRSSSTLGPGMAFVFSGKTHKQIHAISSPYSGSNAAFGSRIAGLGDIDGDGHADFMVGAPGDNNRGAVYVYSGKSGQQLFRLAGNDQPTKFGAGLAAIEDMDLDKVGDIAILANSVTRGSTVVNAPTWIYSGRTGKLIRRVDPVGTLIHSDGLLRLIEDLDGDKKPDLVMNFSGVLSGKSYRGQVQVFSSKDGKLLATCQAPQTQTNISFGEGFDTIPDSNGDGSPEILVGDRFFVSGLASLGAVHHFEARTGKRQTSITTPLLAKTQTNFGQSVVNLGDLNKDGNPDFGARFEAHSVSQQGLSILCARPLDLTSDTSSLGLFRGGKVVFYIHAGTTEAGSLCMMLGTASGTLPGILIGKERLLLNNDAYLSFTLAAPLAVFTNNLSTLDPQGLGQIGFTLPTGLPASIAGKTLHHSCLFLGKSGLTFANTAVPLELTRF